MIMNLIINPIVDCSHNDYLRNVERQTTLLSLVEHETDRDGVVFHIRRESEKAYVQRELYINITRDIILIDFSQIGDR